VFFADFIFEFLASFFTKFFSVTDDAAAAANVDVSGGGGGMYICLCD